MRFRKILLSFSTWRRYRQAKAKLARLTRRFNETQANLSSKLDAKDVYYQKQLAIERKRFELMHVEWAATLIRATGNKVQFGLATTDLESRIDLENNEPNAPLMLTPAQSDYLADVKESYWEQGEQLGKTPYEIESGWESQIKERAMADALQSVN